MQKLLFLLKLSIFIILVISYATSGTACGNKEKPSKPAMERQALPSVQNCFELVSRYKDCLKKEQMDDRFDVDTLGKWKEEECKQAVNQSEWFRCTTMDCRGMLQCIEDLTMKRGAK